MIEGANSKLATRCRYDEGMLANEPQTPSIVSHYFQGRAACVHQAGHAAVGYAMGRRIAVIGVYEHAGAGKSHNEDVTGGIVKFAPLSEEDFEKLCEDGFNSIGFREGVIAAAGPAAERLSRLQAEDNHQPLIWAADDHAEIVRLAKSAAIGSFDSESTTGRRRQSRRAHAFRELVWRYAQQAVEKKEINEAIWELGGAIIEEWEMIDLEEVRADRDWAIFNPFVAEDIIRSCGVEFGMLMPR